MATNNIGELMAKVEDEDFLEFGLIPEIVGRLPVVCSLHDLDRSALLRILVEPKNALIRQYQKYFEMEGIELEFDPAALDAIVDIAIKRKTGARALRSIMESSMIEIMYELPSQTNIKRCIITKEVIEKGAQPEIIQKAIRA
ncbi:MAG TPA: hypothetical protein DCZ43_07060 [candidate division Zixibacteria bacterium]|nr:hypothetical protein [candidate division Zixibacteria bacterium]